MKGKELLEKRKIIHTWIPLLILVGIGVMFQGYGDRLFYYPSKVRYSNPEEMGVSYKPFSFPSRDGTLLSGWFVPAQDGEPKGTIIHYHGNAENMTTHFLFVYWLPKEGFNLVTFDYRGYGESEGTPTRQGTIEDGQAVIAHVREMVEVDEDRLLILGQSLGGAIALASLGEGSRTGVRAIAVDSTFVSYQGVARDIYGRIPILGWLSWPLVGWLVSEEHSPHLTLNHLKDIPILILHGDQDKVVPVRQGQRLFEACPEPKRYMEIKGGHHTDALDRGECRKELVSFFEKALASRE